MDTERPPSSRARAASETGSPRVLLFIPCYNAALTLERVLRRIPAALAPRVTEILVIDNASKDDTGGVAVKLREQLGLANLTVLRNHVNEGYGGSQKIAYRYAIDHGFDYAVMLHGDGQYPPEMVADLLDLLIDDRAGMLGMAFGSRIAGDPLKGGMPIIRFLGNRFLTFCQNLLVGGTWLTEFHSGFRAYRLGALARVPFESCTSDYPFDTQVVINLIHHRIPIAEIPIPTHYGDEKNYVNIWKYGFQVLFSSLRYFVGKVRLATLPYYLRPAPPPREELPYTRL